MTRVIILIVIIATISLSACQSNNSHAVVYNTSVDVPLYHWTSADTLFYPLAIAEEPNAKQPIQLNKDYHVRLNLRHNLDFPLTSIPANFCLQQTDTVQGQTRISRRIMLTRIEPKVRDDRGLPLGDGWGSLYEYQQPLDNLTIRFDKAGTYRFIIIPDFRGAADGLNGMASIGIELYE